MRFKTDENLPRDVVDVLRRGGHDVLSVIDQQLQGHSDNDVAAVCRSERRALITLDLDFADMRTYPPRDFDGIVILRPAQQSVTSIPRLTGTMVQLFDTERLNGHLGIVEDGHVRIRGSHASPAD